MKKENKERKMQNNVFNTNHLKIIFARANPRERGQPSDESENKNNHKTIATLFILLFLLIFLRVTRSALRCNLFH